MYGYKTLLGVKPLEMNKTQQQIYDAIYSKWKFGYPVRKLGVATAPFKSIKVKIKFVSM